jgi:hypothetical protein
VTSPNPGPLARFLPPIPDGLATAWLRKHLAPGNWVLDPFGASPRLVVEAAWAGYRVLVTSNNPIARSLLEWNANPPSEDDLRAALAELASSYKGNERIEPHIKSLYTTECARCGKPVMAEYFLWERQTLAPFAKYYHCPDCGDTGERPAGPADAARAAQFSSSGLHRARALERVAAINDPDRAHAEEALSVYLPRAVYALFTLINKLDGLSLTPTRRSILQGLLLNACDQANTLWAYPTERERPRSLTTPHRFRENNTWLALEQGLSLWKDIQAKAPLVFWPDQPPVEGGICLFEGRLKDLTASQFNEETNPITAVITALPRPNQAFWTLSALWAGWLWGREAVGPFKNVLRRRRYDWAWHTAALNSTFSSLSPILEANTPFWGLIGEAEPGFVTAALIAAEEASFTLDGVCMRRESSPVQITWRRSPQPIDSNQRVDYAHQRAAQAARDYLLERGEPADFMHVQAAALAALAQDHKLLVTPRANEPPRWQDSKPGENPEPSPARYFASIQSMLKDVFAYRTGFRRYEGSEQSLEIGHWWLKEAIQTSMPLADRIEIALVRFLQNHSGCTLMELDNNLCEAFPGLFTPDLELIQVCLDSYGEQQPANSGNWRLRITDTPAARHGDLEAGGALISRLGTQLGFIVSEQPDPGTIGMGTAATKTATIWSDKSGQTRYIIYILASALLGEVVFQRDLDETPEASRIIILPGSRANLVAYKLINNPQLKQELENGWHIIKYRHLRRLAESPFLTPDIFREQLNKDPIT